MCGVLGVIGPKDEAISWAAFEVYRGLLTLQHRGQDAAGILTYDEQSKRFYCHKDLGLVAAVFDQKSIEKLHGNIAIGHTRYATVGSDEREDLQPMVSGQAQGVGMAHNGNIVNYYSLRDLLREKYKQQMLTQNDLEVLINLWVQYTAGESDFSFDRAVKAVESIFDLAIGGYAVVGMVASIGMFGFRDPNGIRPLILGKKETENGTAYILSSETVAMNFLGFEYLRDIRPGEFILIGHDGNIQSALVGKSKKVAHCMFEWIYFSGAESAIDNVSVYAARLGLGKMLGKRIRKMIENKEIDPDIVVAVPDTSRATGIALAEELKIPYREALIKNRYVQRSFILSSNQKREDAVKFKLSPIPSEINGKKILLVDDSVVRGTTSIRIIELLRKYGAKEVTLVSACPPIRFPCYYGLDFPSTTELVACNRNEKEVAEFLKADGMVYLDINDLSDAIGCNSLCQACLDGNYPTCVEEGKKLFGPKAWEIVMKILVLFGSRSDENIYEPLIKSLQQIATVSFDIISAHRDPIKLEQRLQQNDYDLVIAGAGLAAHLPGVIASKTEKMVIGIPVAANFGGLDAFLSIVQMPAGVPVLACGPINSMIIVSFLKSLNINSDKINIVMSNEWRSDLILQRELERMIELSYKNNISLSISDQRSEEFFNIILVKSENEVQKFDNCIYVPYLTQSEKKDPTLVIRFFNLSSAGGLWVGVNNLRNGLLSFIKLKQISKEC
jgi:amidophosphoribosyltransferase